LCHKKKVVVILKKILFIIFQIVFFSEGFLFADTIILKNGKQEKGMVVKQYSDRVLFKDIKGERNILLSDIEKVEYSSPDQNLLSLGNKCVEEKKFEQALTYYQAALKLNPTSKPIQDAILMVRNITFRQKDEFQLKNLQQFKETAMLQDISRSKRGRNSEAKEIDNDSLEFDLDKCLGIGLVKENEDFKIKEIKPGSAAAMAKLLVGDEIIAIWGKLIGYNSLEEIQKILIGPSLSDVKFTIQRRVIILRKDKYWFQSAFEIINARLKFNSNGLIIYDIEQDGAAEMAGLKEGDIVTEIDGVSTNYMNIESIKKKLSGEEGSKLEIIILREVSLRRQ